MLRPKIIECAFCQGTGENPHYKGTCPVCKGRGKNQITGVYTNCQDCRGSGRKLGTTLSCYSCGGLGVVADRQVIIKKARAEFKKGLAEMEEGKRELKRKPPSTCRSRQAKQYEDENPKEESQMKVGGKSRYCQNCANEVTEDTLMKICLKCFKKLKKESL